MKHELTQDQVIEKLRKAVQDAGSQRELARRIGVPVQNVNAVLMGAYAPTKAIRTYLGVGVKKVYFEY